MSVCYKFKPRGCIDGWKTTPGPLFQKGFEMCQDPFVLKMGDVYKMWFSWTKPRLIAYCESSDGVNWEYPTVVLPALTGSSWEGHEVSRPCVVYRNGVYHMWYAGIMYPTEYSRPSSCIGYAQSRDGLSWERRANPVLRPEDAWECRGLTYPHVLWDEEEQQYKMWYSGGDLSEADAIGYAASSDGVHWRKHGQNPVLRSKDGRYFEVSKVEGAYVLRQDDWYYMFYMGVDGDEITSVGMARSRNGIDGWQRHPSNPVYSATDGTWDWIGARGPCVLNDNGKLRMWYSGKDRRSRAIGLLERETVSLDFDPDAPDERGFGECHGEPNHKINRHIARF